MRWNPRRLGAVTLGIAVAAGLTIAAPAAAYAESNGQLYDCNPTGGQRWAAR